MVATLPSADMGFYSWCPFDGCARLVWSGSADVLYVQSKVGQFYAHEACTERYDRRFYPSLFTKDEWKNRGPAPVPAVQPIFPAAEFVPLARVACRQKGWTLVVGKQIGP